VRGTSAVLKVESGAEPMRIGVFIGEYFGNVLASNSYEDLSLIVENNGRSILQYLQPWFRWRQTSLREFEIELDAKHPLADSITTDQQLKVQNNIFIIKEVTRNITTTDRGQISVKCRKI
jgi:hypothetical protein